MKKKPNRAPRRPESMKAIAWRIIALVLAIWLCAMALITYCVAADLYRQLQYNAQAFASLYADTELSFAGVNRDAPGYADYCRLESMGISSRLHIRIRPTLLPLIGTGNVTTYQEGDLMPYELAVSYRSSDGELYNSGTNYWRFPYVSAEYWDSNLDLDTTSGYAYINVDALGISPDTWSGLLRLTGWFEGNQFFPITVEDTPRSLDAIDRKQDCIWNVCYQSTTLAEKELVTIYAQKNLDLLDLRSDSQPVTIDGTEYPRLEEVLPTAAKRESLTDAVVRGYGTYLDRTGEVIRVSVALRAQPLRYALSQMLWFYLITLLLTVPAVWLILRSIRSNLVLPVAQVAKHTSGRPLPLSMRCKPRWKEARMLEDNYDALAQAYYDATVEANQLRTALDYAKTAEEHRRQLICDITHELKTPLAVIHSYAEGLCEGIAADKQEQYLNIILNETEQMDTMVLKMLELSRLEAGKVRLAADQFSLVRLTRSIFDTLTSMAQKRRIQIHYVLTEDFDITADEGRISQVITNFATNAIKYTPEGGNVWISVCRHSGRTIFKLENECDPLPPEALESVWNSFYRVDSSRTTPGTGLGLTIAKAIIELHGGTVHASGTSNGVEFRFELP